MLFFDKSKLATSKMAVSKMASFCNLLSCTTLSTQLHSTTILEGNGVDFMFATRLPLRIHCAYGRRLPNVYEFATISEWCTVYSKTNSYVIVCHYHYSVVTFRSNAGSASGEGPFKCYVTLFSWKFDPHPPPRNANNIGP